MCLDTSGSSKSNRANLSPPGEPDVMVKDAGRPQGRVFAPVPRPGAGPALGAIIPGGGAHAGARGRQRDPSPSRPSSAKTWRSMLRRASSEIGRTNGNSRPRRRLLG